MDNKLINGTVNPEFIVWTEQDKQVIDVPLWAAERNWRWIEKGAEWEEECHEITEIQLFKDTVSCEPVFTQGQENRKQV